MKSKSAFLIALLSILFTVSALAQELIQYPAPSLELKIRGYGGKNGAAVVFNPEAKLYYCVMGGNEAYPLETFDISGNNIYQAEAYSDMRGMWWNPKAKALEGNCYNDGGIIAIGLTEKGYAGTGNKIVFEGSDHQPSEHTCGTIDYKGKEILYFNEGVVIGYSRKSGDRTDTYIYLSLPVDQLDINWSTLIYTGKKGMELGLLDVYSRKVYLFNQKDGSLAATVNLPRSVELYDAFNFSYANNYVFLFDQAARKWVGYRIF